MDHKITAALGPWWTHDHGATQPLRGSRGCCDSSERERERERRTSSTFSPMALHGGGATEMATRRRSTEVACGAPLGRSFRALGR
jgi:hypothetical protein